MLPEAIDTNNRMVRKYNGHSASGHFDLGNEHAETDREVTHRPAFISYQQLRHAECTKCNLLTCVGFIVRMQFCSPKL